MLLAAGQRFCAGTNEIQRLVDYDFEMLPKFLRCLCKNWFRFLKGCCCDLACMMASMIIVHFFRTMKAAREEVHAQVRVFTKLLISFIAFPEIGLQNHSAKNRWVKYVVNPPLQSYNAVALQLLAAGQRFCAGTNEIQRLVDYDFETLPSRIVIGMRCLCKNWYRFLKCLWFRLAYIMASMIIVHFFRTMKAASEEVMVVQKQICFLDWPRLFSI